jgi:hypothetical protein
MRAVPLVLEWRTELKTVTPSRWTSLMQCAAKGWVDILVLDGKLPDPPLSRGILVGRLHHRMMELAVTVSSPGELDARMEEEIAALQRQIVELPHLRRAGSVSAWTEINASVSLAMRVFELRGQRSDAEEIRVEEELKSKDGLFNGRPDVFRIHGTRASLREYKTGAIRDKSGNIKPAYLDQVAIYAALILDNYDVETVAVSLDSLDGDRHETMVDRDQVRKLSQHVTGVIAKLNERVRSADSFAELAQPSQDGCSYCSLRSICSPFKGVQDELELVGEQLLAEGAVELVGERQNDALMSVSFNDECREMNFTVSLPASVASQMVQGRRYQLLNLRRRGGTLEWGQVSQALSYE